MAVTTFKLYNAAVVERVTAEPETFMQVYKGHFEM